MKSKKINKNKKVSPIKKIKKKKYDAIDNNVIILRRSERNKHFYSNNDKHDNDTINDNENYMINDTTTLSNPHEAPSEDNNDMIITTNRIIYNTRSLPPIHCLLYGRDRESNFPSFFFCSECHYYENMMVENAKYRNPKHKRPGRYRCTTNHKNRKHPTVTKEERLYHRNKYAIQKAASANTSYNDDNLNEQASVINNVNDNNYTINETLPKEVVIDDTESFERSSSSDSVANATNMPYDELLLLYNKTLDDNKTLEN